jgi:hypothetical protein
VISGVSATAGERCHRSRPRPLWARVVDSVSRSVPAVAKLQRPTKYVCFAKIRTRKSLLSFGASGSFVGGCERPRSPRGVSGGYGATIGTAPFLGERPLDLSPSCLVVTRPPKWRPFHWTKCPDIRRAINPTLDSISVAFPAQSQSQKPIPVG